MPMEPYLCDAAGKPQWGCVNVQCKPTEANDWLHRHLNYVLDDSSAGPTGTIGAVED